MAAYQDDGRWRWRIQIQVAGEKRRGSGTSPVNTKRAALAAEHEWIEQQLSGQASPKACPTLGAVSDLYLAHVRAHRSPGLADARASLLRKHLRPAFGRTRLDRIGILELDRYKEEKIAAGLMPGTINQQLLGLSNLLRWAKDRGWLRQLPKIEILPQTEQQEEKLEFLADSQLEVLLASVTGELRTEMLFAAHTGVRIGELMALRWTDIDLRAGLVRVQRSSYKGRDVPTKNKRSRVVPLSATALASMKAHRHLRGELVFCEHDGRRHVYATMRDRAIRHGLAGWHVLRHTFGTTLAARGVPLRAIQEWMGHRSIKTTMIYAHFSPVYSDAIGVLDGKTWQSGANRSAAGLKNGGESDE